MDLLEWTVKGPVWYDCGRLWVTEGTCGLLGQAIATAAPGPAMEHLQSLRTTLQGEAEKLTQSIREREPGIFGRTQKRPQPCERADIARRDAVLEGQKLLQCYPAAGACIWARPFCKGAYEAAVRCTDALAMDGPQGQTLGEVYGGLVWRALEGTRDALARSLQKPGSKATA